MTDIRRDRRVKPPKDLGALPQIAYEHQDYSASPGASRDLYLMNSDGTGKTKIPLYGGGGLVTRIDPALSSDGSRIAFASNPTGAAKDDAALDIFTMNLDGSGLIRLTQGGGNRQPAWSRDRSQIAFRHTVSNALGEPGVYVMNADGSAVRRLPIVKGAMWPDWSPDGSRLLYVQNAPAEGIIYAHSFGGQPDYVVWYTPPSEYGYRPAWSPDGSKVALTAPGDVIAVVNADGTGSRVDLTIKGPNDVNEIDRKPSWSPDGRKIVFERFDPRVNVPDGTTNIFVVDAIGGLAPPRQLTTGLYNGAPSWASIRITLNVAPPNVSPTR